MDLSELLDRPMSSAEASAQGKTFVLSKVSRGDDESVWAFLQNVARLHLQPVPPTGPPLCSIWFARDELYLSRLVQKQYTEQAQARLDEHVHGSDEYGKGKVVTVLVEHPFVVD